MRLFVAGFCLWKGVCYRKISTGPHFLGQSIFHSCSPPSSYHWPPVPLVPLVHLRRLLRYTSSHASNSLAARSNMTKWAPIFFPTGSIVWASVMLSGSVPLVLLVPLVPVVTLGPHSRACICYRLYLISVVIKHTLLTPLLSYISLLSDFTSQSIQPCCYICLA